MQFNEYQIEAGKTAVYPGRNSNLVYTLLGLCSELGEMVEKVLQILNRFEPGDDQAMAVIYDVLSDAEYGLSGCEKLKKIIRDGDNEESSGLVYAAKRINERINETDHDALSLELGDLLWYLSQTSYELGVKFDDIAQWNVNKLKSRQDRDKLHGSGDNR